MCAQCGNGPYDSPLLGEKELGLPEGKTPLPLCTVCHTANKAPVLVNRADQATKELGRKEKKADAKKAVVAEKAAPKPRPAKGARAGVRRRRQRRLLHLHPSLTRLAPGRRRLSAWLAQRSRDRRMLGLRVRRQKTKRLGMAGSARFSSRKKPLRQLGLSAHRIPSPGARQTDSDPIPPRPVLPRGTSTAPTRSPNTQPRRVSPT